MAGHDFTPIREAASAHFDRLERYGLSPGEIQLNSDDNQQTQELEARLVQAAGALLALGQNPLVGEEDQKDLRINVRRMSAALRLKGYQQWDARVIFDEDIYRGTEPAGQSEYILDSVAQARSEFLEAANQFSRIAMLAGAIGSPADHDDLLPLLRRKNFNQDIYQFLKDAEGSRQPVALLMIDVDHFKNVNDNHGHPVGDEALKSVAEVIKQVVAGKGRAYRYGGEEMAVLALNMSVGEAAALGERIRQTIEREERTSKKLKITVSVGVAVAPDHADNVKALIDIADAALYSAKNSGRNLTHIGGDSTDDRQRAEASSDREHSRSEPFKIPRMNDVELEKVASHYRSSGMEPVLPRMEERDVKLARGYKLAHYPGTGREVWVGFNNGSYEHLLMLKPSAVRPGASVSTDDDGAFVANIDALGITEISDRWTLLFLVSVVNRGSPSILQHWQLYSQVPGEARQELKKFEANADDEIVIESGKDGSAIQIKPADFIAGKTFPMQVPSGGSQRGFLMAQLSKEPKSGTSFAVSFEDAHGNRYSTEFAASAGSGPVPVSALGHWPGVEIKHGLARHLTIPRIPANAPRVIACRYGHLSQQPEKSIEEGLFIKNLGEPARDVVVKPVMLAARQISFVGSEITHLEKGDGERFLQASVEGPPGHHSLDLFPSFREWQQEQEDLGAEVTGVIEYSDYEGRIFETTYRIGIDVLNDDGGIVVRFVRQQLLESHTLK